MVHVVSRPENEIQLMHTAIEQTSSLLLLHKLLTDSDNSTMLFCLSNNDKKHYCFTGTPEFIYI